MNHEEGRKYAWSDAICTSGYVSEGEWFHVISCEMNYINEECADMHLILDEARENSTEAERLYAERLPNRRTPSRHFEHQLWIWAFVFIAYFLIKWNLFIIHFVQYL
jgi:hypothetical protein